MTVVGNSKVMAFTSSEGNRPAKVKNMASGARADLVALRASNARRTKPLPPIHFTVATTDP
jgi:hypothetical protein